MLEWETVESTHANKNVTVRAKILGGWLVKHRSLTKLMDTKEKGGGSLQTASLGLCFVPDPLHAWEIK